MLVLSRRAGERIDIRPAKHMPLNLTVNELFAGGPITIALISSGSNFARIGIDAPNALSIVRDDRKEK